MTGETIEGQTTTVAMIVDDLQTASGIVIVMTVIGGTE
jgi:hypothetical protein